jgi:hypothetical protein
MYSLRRDNSLKEQYKHACQGARADDEVDQTGYSRLELFRECLIFRQLGMSVRRGRSRSLEWSLTDKIMIPAITLSIARETQAHT